MPPKAYTCNLTMCTPQSEYFALYLKMQITGNVTFTAKYFFRRSQYEYLKYSPNIGSEMLIAQPKTFIVRSVFCIKQKICKRK